MKCLTRLTVLSIQSNQFPGEEILSRLKGTLEWMCLVTMIEGRAATKAGR
jgi:hypothetical protein